MAIVTVPKARSTVSTRSGDLEIIIPSRLRYFSVAFLSVWLCGWFAGESSAIAVLLSGKAQAQGAGFMLVWLAGWTVGGCFAATILGWNLAGRETLLIGHGEFARRLAVGPFGWTRRYDLSQVKDLRTTPPPEFWTRRNSWIGRGTIAFDYGSSTVRVGVDIDEAEAKSLIETISNRTRW